MNINLNMNINIYMNPRCFATPATVPDPRDREIVQSEAKEREAAAKYNDTKHSIMEQS